PRAALAHSCLFQAWPVRYNQKVKNGLALIAGLTAALVAATPALPARAGSGLTYKGTVARIVDGDTIVVRLATGRTERVRLIGIDTPELPNDCYARAARRAAATLASGRRVTLHGDSTQDLRDRYERLLAYVDLAGGTDLGRLLLARGDAVVYVYNRPFRRLAS